MVASALALVLSADPRWGLTFSAPPQCIQPGELAEKVEQQVGRPLFGANPELRIEGHVRPGTPPAKWAARLTLLDAAGTVLGTRDVTGEKASCRAIDESLVLVIALMIDTKVKEPATPPPVVEKPATPPPPPPALVKHLPTDDFSRLLRRERGGFFLGGFEVDRGAFYAMVDRPDLQASLASRRGGKLAAFFGGAAFVLAGGLLVSLELIARTGQDTHWPVIAGLSSLGLGLVGFIIGALIDGSPTTDDEDDGLIEQWNVKQRVSTE